MARTKLFLDVDGVLLGKEAPGDPGVVLARHAEEFVDFILAHFDCYWLTTHCSGDTERVLRHLKRYCSPELLAKLKMLKATMWRTMKTEALKGVSDFVWLDDAPLATELQWLKNKGLYDRWVRVDTRSEPDDLLRAMQVLSALRAPDTPGC